MKATFHFGMLIACILHFLPGAEALADTNEKASRQDTGNRGTTPTKAIVGFALQQDWREVYDRLSSPSGNDVELPKKLLLGYASLNRRDWLTAWRQFSDIDSSTRKESLLQWSAEVRANHPTSAVASVLEGDALARCGRHRDAITALDRATQLDPALAFAYDIRGLVWMLAEMMAADGLGRAAQDFEMALKLDPDNPHPMYQRAMVDMLRGESKAAVERLSRVLALEPNFLVARNARGIAFVLEGRFEDALRDFDLILTACPEFASARSNRVATAMIRARGLFAVDLGKLAKISAKGVLGSEASPINFHYAGSGINSPTGGDILDLATQRAGENPHVVTIRERDYVSRGITPDDPSFETSIATFMSMETRQARAEGRNIVLNVIPNTENYHTELATDYMFGSPKWDESTDFCASVMDSAIQGYRQVEPQGLATADVHSQHADVAAHTTGPTFDHLTVVKGRTGGGLEDHFAQRCEEYYDQGKTVNIITGAGDVWSLGNIATKSTAEQIAEQGWATLLHDKLPHGHSAFTGNTIYEVHTQAGTREAAGNLTTLTGPQNICHDFCEPDTRSGVFLKLGNSNMDVTRARTTDLSFLHKTPNKQPVSHDTPPDREPDFSYPFMVFNHQPPVR